MVDADQIRVPVVLDDKTFRENLKRAKRESKELDDAGKKKRGGLGASAFVGGAVGGFVGGLMSNVEQGTLGVLLEALATVFIALFWPFIQENLPAIAAAVVALGELLSPALGIIKGILEGIFNFFTGGPKDAQGRPTRPPSRDDYLGGIIASGLAMGGAGAAIGAGIGSIVPGVGTLAGGIIGGVAGAAVGSFAGWAEVDGRTQAWLTERPPAPPMDADVEFRMGGWRSPDAVLAGGG